MLQIHSSTLNFYFIRDRSANPSCLLCSMHFGCIFSALAKWMKPFFILWFSFFPTSEQSFAVPFMVQHAIFFWEEKKNDIAHFFFIYHSQYSFKHVFWQINTFIQKNKKITLMRRFFYGFNKTLWSNKSNLPLIFALELIKCVHASAWNWWQNL